MTTAILELHHLPLATARGTSESWQSSHGLLQRLNGRFCRPCGAKDFWKSSFPRLRMAAWKRPMRLRLDVIGSLKWEERRWVLWWNRVFFFRGCKAVNHESLVSLLRAIPRLHSLWVWRKPMLFWGSFLPQIFHQNLDGYIQNVPMAAVDGETMWNSSSEFPSPTSHFQLSNRQCKCQCLLQNPDYVLAQFQISEDYIIIYLLVGGLEHFLFFHILGISSSQLTNSYFSEG